MHIDSARELKALCLKQFLKPLTVVPQAATALAIAARNVNVVESNPRTMAIGLAVKGKGQYRLAVRVQNRALMDSPNIEALSKRAKGEVDVRYVGRVVKRAPWHQSRQRPLLIGCSIGHFRITAGTLGCFVRTTKSGTPYILSNNHVLADENAGKAGDTVIQPGRYDRGKKKKDKVGGLASFVRLSRSKTNFVDAALSTIRKGIEFDATTLRGLGTLTGSANHVDIGDRVNKVGRTTGATRGRVTAIELDNVIVGYDMGNLRFDDQIEIEGAEAGPFSRGGDSGSVIVNADGKAVALLFAGGDFGGTNGQGFTYANPIQTVFDELGVALLT